MLILKVDWYNKKTMYYIDSYYYYYYIAIIFIIYELYNILPLYKFFKD